MWSIDARVPVRFGSPEEAGDGDAVLTEAGFGPAHAPACTCCAGRSGAALALGRLFERRARGEVPFFRRVLVVASDEAREAVQVALAEDAVASARFKLEGR